MRRSYNNNIFLWRIFLLLLFAVLSSSVILQGNSEAGVDDSVNKYFTQNGNDIPSWFGEYIHWHRSMRSSSDALNNNKILIVEAARGGLADRIKNIPYFVWLAARHKRLLLIADWGLTCHITNFLRPNLIDWTIPSASENIRSNSVSLNGPRGDLNEYFNHLVGDEDLERHVNDRIVSIRSNHQSFYHGLNKVYQESNLNRKVFHYIFHSIFRLSEPIQQMLDQTKKELNLINQEYFGFHLRLRYPGTSKVLNPQGNEDHHGFTNITTEMTKEMLRIGENAVRCVKTSYEESNNGNTTNNNRPVVYYGASDTVHALKVLKEKYSNDNNINIKYLPPDKDGERLHSGNNVPSNEEGQPNCSKLYPTIIDLWILSDAKCITFGHGGYGSLSLMLSNFECWTIHQYNNALFENSYNFPYFHKPQTNQLPKCFEDE